MGPLMDAVKAAKVLAGWHFATIENVLSAVVRAAKAQSNTAADHLLLCKTDDALVAICRNRPVGMLSSPSSSSFRHPELPWPRRHLDREASSCKIRSHSEVFRTYVLHNLS